MDYYHKYIKYKNKYFFLLNDMSGGASLTIDDIFKMTEVELKKANINEINKIIKSKGFPYKYHSMTEQSVNEMFNNLKKYEPTFNNKTYTIQNIHFKIDLLYKGKPTVIIQKEEDYLKYNNLSDYFQQVCRMKCVIVNRPSSPFDYWNKNTEKIIKYAINKYKKLDYKILSDSAYELIPFECSAFRPTLMVSFIKMFNGKSILDFSSGWGDRLLGAMACDEIIDFYCGVDPNECLHPNYKKMIDFFKQGTQKFVIIKSMFQTAIVPTKKYNLIFTSPPYFTLESYSNDKTQSVHNATLDSWFNNFLIYSINKSWKLLEVDGHMCININDFNKGRLNKIEPHKYVERMINYINSNFDNSEYLGVISYGYIEKQPQPIWIWKKKKQLNNNNDCIIDRQLDKFLNTEIKIIPITNNNKTFNIIRDDFLMGGTKQRMIQGIIESNPNYSEYVYAGPIYGYAQIALAYVGSLMNKKITIFVETKNPLYQLTNQAKLYGANIMNVKINATLKEVQQASEEYVKNNKSICLLPFGLHNDEYIKLLACQIKKAFKKYLLLNAEPKRLWLVAGSATLLNALYIVFPNTYFNIIQVGRTVWDDLIDKTRTKLYISDEKFYNKSEFLPPYPSVATYDAKLWKYVLKDGIDGDYVWNVAKDII
jgi:hypothetical protein